ncbi:hypothetical protein BLM15_29185 (plasmid) [Bosea sp. Tri-49]|nr:hypothetical protein BLM15_29185 [Bosea sp. Tri-49]
MRADQARLEKADLSAAVHLPLNEFETGDLAFGLAVRPGERMAARTAASSHRTPFANKATRLCDACSIREAKGSIRLDLP